MMTERIGPHQTAEDITTAQLRQALKRAHSGADEVERVDADDLVDEPDPDPDPDLDDVDVDIDDEVQDRRLERATKSRDTDPSPCPMGCEWEGYNIADHIHDDHS